LLDYFVLVLEVMVTWAQYLVRGVSNESLEFKPVVDKSMYPKGLNAPFLNIEGKPAETVVVDYTGRFENHGRDIARSAPDIINLLKSDAGLGPGQTVVDFGSGTGLFLKDLARVVTPRGAVLATEISAVFRDHLIKRTLADEELKQTVKIVYNNDGRDPNLTGYNGTIDVVFICDVYHHLEWPLSVMRNLRKALRPEGRLVLIDFHRDKEIHKSHPEDEDWIFKHVRAGQEVFREEICSCGFELVSEPPCAFIPENYVMIFKPSSEKTWQQPGTGWGTKAR